MSNSFPDQELLRYSLEEFSNSIFELGPAASFNANLYLHSKNILLIESFVHECATNNETPFVPFSNAGRTDYHGSSLALSYFQYIHGFVDTINTLSAKYEYSEYVNVFITCSHAMKLEEMDLHWGNIWQGKIKLVMMPNHRNVLAVDLFNDLVERVRIECKRENVKSKIRSRRREANDRFKDYCRYIDALFAFRARLIVIRVDLGYRKEISSQIDIYEANRYMNHLIANMRCQGIFSHKIGYIIKLEFGVEKGFHFHLLLFFDGAERKNSSHAYLAQEIGEYWSNVITSKRGTYWNCNDQADQFEHFGIRGIGVISWTDTNLINNLKYRVLAYLCKIDQFIRPKVDSKVRLIRRGMFPKVAPNKRGAPRRKMIEDDDLVLPAIPCTLPKGETATICAL